MSPSVAFVLLASIAVVFGNNVTFNQLQSEWEGRIVGGREARPGQFPHHVGLRFQGGVFYCGGSILNHNWVLTAAHCTHGRLANPTHIHAVVGAHRRGGDGQTHIVARVVLHPQYNHQGRANDISLLYVRRPIEFNERVRPVLLPAQNINVNGNIPVLLSGWGQLRHVNIKPPFPNVLKFQQSVTLSHTACVGRFPPNWSGMVHENTVCTNNPIRAGACGRDNGGPLITKNGVQIGVLSWIIPCGRGFPDVYASVFHHLGFIRSVIGGN